MSKRRYAAYVGEPSKRDGYRSQKLPGGDHSALGDALATLRLIEEMGHATINITLDTYSHVLPDMQNKAADRLGALLS